MCVESQKPEPREKTIQVYVSGCECYLEAHMMIMICPQIPRRRKAKCWAWWKLSAQKAANHDLCRGLELKLCPIAQSRNLKPSKARN